MDYQFSAAFLISLVNLYFAYRMMRFVESQPTLAPLPTVAFVGRIKRYWPIMAMLVLSLSSWIPYFLHKCPVDYFLAWGRDGNHLYIVADTRDLIKEKPNRLMVIARGSNPAFDEKTDTQILKSATFQISASPMRMDAAITPEFINQVSGLGTLEECLLLVPEEFPIEAIHSLVEAEKRDGKILGCKSWSHNSR